MGKITIKKSTLRRATPVLILAAVVALAVILITSTKGCGAKERKDDKVSAAKEVEPPKIAYGIEYESYDLREGRVGSGQTLSHILGEFGIRAAMIDKIDRTAKPVFNLRNMRAGNAYMAFFTRDSIPSLRYFVYEKSLTDYVVIDLPEADSVTVYEGQKEVTVNRRKETARITSSLWNCIADNNLPVALSSELEDIYGWTVDFFALRVGDEFTVIFDERYIDTMRIGVGRVWGAEFKHGGRTYYAIPFSQGGKIEYWDEQGNSLRKQLLKAPLKFTRISSKFSNARMHPVHRVVRPHHGVDYAAPSGTPVVAIADGTVTMKGWGGGGGNQLKIKHANNLTSGYLHLKGYAKGIALGSRVKQGQVIGYVGSTGTSTGPHLDFRLWKGSTPIDPLKAPSNPVEPIAAANREYFNGLRDRVLAELEADVPDSVRITADDLVVKKKRAPAADSVKMENTPDKTR